MQHKRIHDSIINRAKNEVESWCGKETTKSALTKFHGLKSDIGITSKRKYGCK